MSDSFTLESSGLRLESDEAMGLRIFLITAGSLLLAYGLYALFSGWVISTWARVEYRTSVQYWITVVALIAIGAVNVGIGIRSFFR